jgi:hypothetical protein
MLEILTLTAVVFVAVTLAIPAGGMLTDLLFNAGLWPRAEWHP